MPSLLSAVATALPEPVADQEQSIAALCRIFPHEEPRFIAGLVGNSGVRERHTVLPVEELFALGDFGERNDLYRRTALDLMERAARTALERAHCSVEDVDVVMDVSCTGISIPALDVFLSPRLGLRPEVLRLPIAESGCAAGALGLGLGSRLAAQGSTVLLMAVELCTLTLLRDDPSRANLIASVLFGDGAGAAVLRPGSSGIPTIAGYRVLASGSYLFPETTHAMGFDIGSHGMRIVLDRSLPVVLDRHLRPAVDSFLERNHLSLADIGLHLVHTGGGRVLDICEKIFGLPHGALVSSREALRRYGNLSSASILTVLDVARELGQVPPPGKKALVVVFGPGLSLEMLLLAPDAD